MTTHCRLASEMCSAFCADGNAMFTMEASRTTISWAMAMTARASQRAESLLRRSRGAGRNRQRTGRTGYGGRGFNTHDFS